MEKNRVGIPLTFTTSHEGIDRFSIDLTDPVNSNVEANTTANEGFLEFTFAIPGAKVPPEGKPPGATHLGTISFNQTESDKGVLEFDSIEANISFRPEVGVTDANRKVAVFKFRCKLNEIRITDK